MWDLRPFSSILFNEGESMQWKYRITGVSDKELQHKQALVFPLY